MCVVEFRTSASIAATKFLKGVLIIGYNNFVATMGIKRSSDDCFASDYRNLPRTINDENLLP